MITIKIKSLKKMNEEETLKLIRSQINTAFLKAGLIQIPKIKIILENPDKNGYLKTPDGKNCLAYIVSNNQKILHMKHYYPDGKLWYEEEIWEEPIQFTFPIGKNEYCYTHIAQHEVIHYIRSLSINNISKKDHDKMFYDLGNILNPVFEYRDKNLCKECPDNRLKKNKK